MKTMTIYEIHDSNLTQTTAGKLDELLPPVGHISTRAIHCVAGALSPHWPYDLHVLISSLRNALKSSENETIYFTMTAHGEPITYVPRYGQAKVTGYKDEED